MFSPRPSKRQRIYRACDQCRRRKSKCDGEQPVCSICRSANRSCTYQKGGSRRGLPSGYVRSLEIVLGLIFQHVPNSESTTHGVLRNYRGKGNFLTSDAAEHSLKVWRSSKLTRDVSQLLTPGSDDLVHDDSEWEPVKTRDHESIDDHGSLPPVPRLNEFATASDSPRAPNEVQSLAIWAIPDNTPDLLDFYFTYTHCWFPILERRALFRAMHVSSSQSTFGPLPCHTLLWSVIIYSSSMKGMYSPGLPPLPAIQLYVQRPLLSGPGGLELDHIQSAMVIALTHVAMGRINQAWLLLGQVARMLATLPLALRKGRFTHTFNGCVFLDNIVSALLGKTPCLSSEEQLRQGPVEEDDLDEWDVWSASRTKTPATPLQALSTFNSVRHLTQNLSQIAYCASSASNYEDILEKLRQEQAGILQHRPYDRDGHATPPLLTLHLTSAFTTLSLIRKFEPGSPPILDLCVRTIHYSLDMLDHYIDLTGGAGSSPLIYCFALQCQRCLDILDSVLISAEKNILEERIHTFLKAIKPHGYLEGDSLRHGIASFTAAQGDHYNTSLTQIPVTRESVAPQVHLATLESRPEPPDVAPPNLYSASNTADPVGAAGRGEYDTLFDEMMLVDSFPPSRYAPPFTPRLICFLTPVDKNLQNRHSH